MTASLKQLDQIVTPKPECPETTPSLRDAIAKGAATVGCYYFTSTLRQYFTEVFESAIHKKGQGYWYQAEYGVGKTHFLATLTLLLTQGESNLWASVKDDDLRKQYEKPLSKVRLFPVCFSLLGAGETDAQDRLMRRFEKEIQASLPADLRGKVSIVSEELAADWYAKEATEYEKIAVQAYFDRVHKTTPEQYAKNGKKKFGAEILKVGLTLDLKSAFLERFVHIYDQVTSHGYDGVLFVIDEFRAWQERHENRDSLQEGFQVLETLAYLLPVEEHRNVITIIASQGDVPQKLMGSGQGDRFVVRPLLADRNRNDYGEIVAYRVRDLKEGVVIDIDEYYNYCRDNFKFVRQANASREYFQAIFPFQPRCFELLRRITQSFDRHNLPAARSGIIIAWDTLQQKNTLQGKRMIVPSDLLVSGQLQLGLRTEQFRIGYEGYQEACEVLATLPMPDDEREAAHRIIGLLYLVAAAMPENLRWLTLTEIAEATMTTIEGLKNDDAVLCVIDQVKADIPQIRWDKDKGARFEIAEADRLKPEQIFGGFKKRARTDKSRQSDIWKKSLFWDFKAIGGAGSHLEIEGGFLHGLAELDQEGNPVLPNTTSAKPTKVNKVAYGGEIVAADHWSGSHGEAWSNKPEVHFRIVYLTQHAKVNSSDLGDARTAVCVPADLSGDTRDNLAELIACDQMLEKWNDRDYPGEGYMREWTKSKRQQVIEAILKNHVEEYRRGTIVTAKGIGIPADQIFTVAGGNRTGREEELAKRLLSKAYDDPMFQSEEFKKDFTDADAAKVFHGLFRPENSRSTAHNSARENFGVGLGLIAKHNPGVFAPQVGGALGWIQEKVRNQSDVALTDLVKDLCQPPHGLIEPMVTLLALCAVRAGDPPLVITGLNQSSGFTLTTGKPPAGWRITSHQFPHIEWSAKLERALHGARLQISTELSWNTVLPWAKILNSELKTSNSPTEELQRNEELMATLTTLKDQVVSTKNAIDHLRRCLGDKADSETDLVFGHLGNMAATTGYQEFHAVAKEAYPDAEADLKPAWQIYQSAVQLAQRFPDLQATKVYLDGCPQLSDGPASCERQAILDSLHVPMLLKNPQQASLAEERFRVFKDKYTHAYRKAHRFHHDELTKWNKQLKAALPKLIAIDRLNQLELGSPIGDGLATAYEALQRVADPCPAKDNASVEHGPACAICKWDGLSAPPTAEAENLLNRMEEALQQLTVRVARGTVRKLLEANPDGGVTTVLEIILASQTDKLAEVLTPEVIERIRNILRDANLEPRDLPLQELLGELTAVEEEDVPTLIRQISERLQAAFKQAKLETEGKKRIRFFLK